jgi:hypothetical protein
VDKKKIEDGPSGVLEIEGRRRIRGVVEKTVLLDIWRNSWKGHAGVALDLAFQIQLDVVFPVTQLAARLPKTQLLQPPHLAGVRLTDLSVGRGQIDVESELLSDLLLLTVCHGLGA